MSVRGYCYSLRKLLGDLSVVRSPSSQRFFSGLPQLHLLGVGRLDSYVQMPLINSLENLHDFVTEI